MYSRQETPANTTLRFTLTNDLYEAHQVSMAAQINITVMMKLEYEGWLLCIIQS